MSYRRCYLYVLKLKKPNYFYVGTTIRALEARLKEHREGWGSKWSTRYGYDEVVESYEVDIAKASTLENQKVIEYMDKYGWRGVRGGDYTYAREDDSIWWLPEKFRHNSTFD